MTAQPDWSDPWVLGGEFLFRSPTFGQQPLELHNLTEYYMFGRDSDDDVSWREFFLRESPTARRSLRAFYASGEHPEREPDELERRYLALPDNGEASWFDQPLPQPTRQHSGPKRGLLSEETRERLRRKDEERAAAQGISVEQLKDERRRERDAKRARRERADAKRMGIPVAEYRRQRLEQRAAALERDERLSEEWEARKVAIRAERAHRLGDPD